MKGGSQPLHLGQPAHGKVCCTKACPAQHGHASFQPQQERYRVQEAFLCHQGLANLSAAMGCADGAPIDTDFFFCYDTPTGRA